MSEIGVPNNETIKIKQHAKRMIDKLNNTEKKIIFLIYLLNDPVQSKQIIEEVGINKSTLSRILKKKSGIENLIEEVTGRNRGKKYKLNIVGEEVIKLLKTGANGPLGNLDPKSMKIQLKNRKLQSYFKWSYPLFNGEQENPHNKIVVFTGESFNGPFPSLLVGDTSFTCHPFVLGNSIHRTLGCCKKDEILLKLEEKIHETHGIFNQGWSVRYLDQSPLPNGITNVIDNKVRVTKNFKKFMKNKWDYELDLNKYKRLEQKEIERRVNYYSGIGAWNLLKALKRAKKLNGDKVEVAWVIFTLDWIVYVIHGEELLEIEAFLPYIPNNKEFVTIPGNEGVVKTEIPYYDQRTVEETTIAMGDNNLIECLGGIRGNNLGALEFKLQIAEQNNDLKDIKDDLRAAWLFKLDEGWKFRPDSYGFENFKRDELFYILNLLEPGYIFADIESNFEVITQERGIYGQISKVINLKTCGSTSDVSVIKSKVVF
jgi:DNA-binding MarR family transcriptional regulator